MYLKSASYTRFMFPMYRKPVLDIPTIGS